MAGGAIFAPESQDPRARARRDGRGPQRGPLRARGRDLDERAHSRDGLLPRRAARLSVGPLCVPRDPDGRLVELAQADQRRARGRRASRARRGVREDPPREVDETSPSACVAAATATALVPDDSVSPTPRSQTRAVTSPGASTRATCTFVRFGKRACVSSQRADRADLGRVAEHDRVRVADRDRHERDAVRPSSCAPTVTSPSSCSISPSSRIRVRTDQRRRRRRRSRSRPTGLRATRRRYACRSPRAPRGIRRDSRSRSRTRRGRSSPGSRGRRRLPLRAADARAASSGSAPGSTTTYVLPSARQVEDRIHHLLGRTVGVDRGRCPGSAASTCAGTRRSAGFARRCGHAPRRAGGVASSSSPSALCSRARRSPCIAPRASSTTPRRIMSSVRSAIRRSSSSAGTSSPTTSVGRRSRVRPTAGRSVGTSDAPTSASSSARTTRRRSFTWTDSAAAGSSSTEPLVRRGRIAVVHALERQRGSRTPTAGGMSRSTSAARRYSPCPPATTAAPFDADELVDRLVCEQGDTRRRTSSRERSRIATSRVGSGRLVREDRQAAIHLERVGRDDLGAEVARRGPARRRTCRMPSGRRSRRPRTPKLVTVSWGTPAHHPLRS